MSVAAANASAFYEQVAKEKIVFTLLDDDRFLVFPIKGKEVVPFWSTRSRVEKVQASHPTFVRYTISDVSLADFLEKILGQLDEEHIHVGVNWSGERLLGYDVSAADVRRNITYWL